METKKQIKAQLRNQISKEYKGRLDSAKQECMTVRVKFIAEQKLRVQAEDKVASLQEELDMYKDWVRRLPEFMDMDPETRENEIKKYKEQRVLDDAFEFVANSQLFKMYNQLMRRSLF